MIKTTVGEFRKFLDADYGREDDGWFEDICFYLDGQSALLENDDGIFSANLDESLAAETQIRFEGGVIVYPLGRGREATSIEPLFRRWRKEQTHSHVLVLVPNDRFAEFEAAAKEIGGKIVH